MNSEHNSDLPVFDKEAFRRRCVYDGELEHTILHGSLKDLESQIHKLKQNYDDQNYQELERTAHALKGTSGTISAMRLHTTAQELELAALALKEEEKEDTGGLSRIKNLIDLTQQHFLEYNTAVLDHYPS